MRACVCASARACLPGIQKTDSENRTGSEEPITVISPEVASECSRHDQALGRQIDFLRALDPALTPGAPLIAGPARPRPELPVPEARRRSAPECVAASAPEIARPACSGVPGQDRVSLRPHLRSQNKSGRDARPAPRGTKGGSEKRRKQVAAEAVVTRPGRPRGARSARVAKLSEAAPLSPFFPRSPPPLPPRGLPPPSSLDPAHLLSLLSVSRSHRYPLLAPANAVPLLPSPSRTLSPNASAERPTISSSRSCILHTSPDFFSPRQTSPGERNCRRRRVQDLLRRGHLAHFSSRNRRSFRVS